MKFRKRPVTVEAVQWTRNTVSDVLLFLAGMSKGVHGGKLIINTLEGPITAEYGDWIIKGVKGEFYPCKPDIFELTYEPVPE